MPLARQMSNSSFASASGRQSFPATITSSTKVNKEKIGKIMNRRKTRRQSAMEDKENDAVGDSLQSPTPYWKVAKERGTNTPPETRSAKKRKTEPKKLDFAAGLVVDDDENNPNGLMLFSPPDPIVNARREKEEFERKKEARTLRVRNARDSGQLLVFSPTFRNPAPLPTTPKEEKAEADMESSGNDSEVSSKTGRNGIGSDKNDVVGKRSPCDLEVEVNKQASEKSQVSLLTSHSNTHNEQISQELKNLRETISKLVDRKSDADDSQQQHLSLEAHMIRTEEILLENSKLEQRIERLKESLNEVEQNSSNEKDGLIAEKDQLQKELSRVSQEAQSHIDALAETRAHMNSKLQESQTQQDELSEQIKTLQAELDDARTRLEESKSMVLALKDDISDERTALVAEQAELRNSKLALEKDYAELKEKNAALIESLEQYENKIDMLENKLLPESEEQLMAALDKLKNSELNDAELRQQMNKLEQYVESLKEQLEQVRTEQQEEHKHFQDLNEESSTAFEHMKNDMEQKDATIEELKAKLETMKSSLDSETVKLRDASEELKTTRSSMDVRATEMEQLLKNVTSELDNTTAEKEALEKKLNQMMVEMEENASFKEKVVAESNETSAANTLLQQRISKLEQELLNSQSQCEEAKQRVECFDQRETELVKKLQESDRVRRGLHNRVMQLSGNIRVYVRVRPELPGEREATKPSETKKRKHSELEDGTPFRYPGIGGHEDNKSALGADDPTKNLLVVTEPWRDRGGLSERRKKWIFGFDEIFTPDHGQDDIWEATEPLVQSAIDGYSVCLFGYGQTGSGKTFTMLGEPGNEGLVSRAVRKLFEARESIAELAPGESKVEVSVELLEVYNEKIRDLLDPDKPEGQRASLCVKSNEAVGSTIIEVDSEEDVAKILAKAQSRRCVKATASNAVSSRSHMLFTIHFKILHEDGSTRVGKLNICDLAGSERLGKSNANDQVGGALLKETKHINTSLSVLSNVIEKLQTGDSNVPYRESKLTHLLQNSLGGNSKTLAIVCCNPLQSHFHESLCSLRFAAKVNKVDLKAVANFSA